MADDTDSGIAGMGKRQFINYVTWRLTRSLETKTTTDTLAEGSGHLVNARQAAGSMLMAPELDSGLPLSVSLRQPEKRSGLPSRGWIGHCRSFKVIHIGAGRNQERLCRCTALDGQ